MMRNGVRRLAASVKKRSMGFVVTVRNSMLMWKYQHQRHREEIGGIGRWGVGVWKSERTWVRKSDMGFKYQDLLRHFKRCYRSFFQIFLMLDLLRCFWSLSMVCFFFFFGFDLLQRFWSTTIGLSNTMTYCGIIEALLLVALNFFFFWAGLIVALYKPFGTRL